MDTGCLNFDAEFFAIAKLPKAISAPTNIFEVVVAGTRPTRGRVGRALLGALF